MSEVGVGVGDWKSALSSSVIVYFVSVAVYIEKKKKGITFWASYVILVA